MDPIVIALIIVVVMPVAVIWALSKSASLRGPLSRPESHKPVQVLVTEAIPEEHPDPDEDEDSGPDFRIDSAPTDPAAPDRVEPQRPDAG